jgi:hypothetical protein
MDLAVGGPKSLAARNLKVKPTSTPKAPSPTGAKLIDPAACSAASAGAACHREAPGAARGATDAREVRVLWPAVQNEQRPGLAHPRGAPAKRDAAGQGRPSRPPRPWSVARTRPTGRRHARTAGASQRRPPWSLLLARGGAGCSAGGHRNPRRGRVAEGGLARDRAPGRRSNSGSPPMASSRAVSVSPGPMSKRAARWS